MEVVREAWARQLVLGVVREALRKTGAVGVVVAGGGPERSLLERWLVYGGVEATAASPRAMALAQELLLAIAGVPDGGAVPWPHGPRVLASVALARKENLLLLGTDTKTHLLLSPTLPHASILPLGDLYASDLLEMEGACGVPPCLEGVDPKVLRAVDEGLHSWLESFMEPTEALSRVEEPLRSRLLETLQEVRRRWIPRYLVPQLRGPTLGIDLDL